MHTNKSITKSGTKRSASPVSISEAARIANQEGPRKRRLLSQETAGINITKATDAPSKTSQSRLQIVQTSTPITPQNGVGGILPAQQTSEWDTNTPQGLELETQRSASSSSTFENPSFDDDPQILSPTSENGRSDREDENDSSLYPSFADSVLSRGSRGISIENSTGSRFGGETEHAYDLAWARLPPNKRPHLRSRPRPQALDTTATQDASLPSPSLSPVTAAANLQNRRSYFEHVPDPAHYHDDGVHSTESLQSRCSNALVARPHDTARDSLTSPTTGIGTLDKYASTADHADRSLMCIPSVIDNFEAMPEEMKQYVMYQLLRRCSKPVLHFVADVVNPALKCDFLKHLPQELSEVILGHLDVKSLCAAAQVSMKWRHQVDLSEKVWKRLFYADGYTLQEGELARAIREGWGWQTVSMPSEAEQDLSLLALGSSDTDRLAPSSVRDSPASHPLRARRKGKGKNKILNKSVRRRKQVRVCDSPDIDEDAYLVMASATDGPYAAASAAAEAISLPRNDLHLWKSIYMRHHIIRLTWLQEQVSPRHIAFRAHQRHVVTCLQFDSEKILTGSDDANINVYDTQTGALRAKLEGHEGGVWALQYEGNVLVSGSTDRSVRVWDIERGICTHTFQGHTSTVRCLQILLPTPTGKGLDGRTIMLPKQPLIITGSRDSHLRVWKLPKPGDPPFHQAGPSQDEATESPYFVRALTGHHHSVRAIAAHADTLVSGSYDCSVRVWKISTGETVHRLQGHTQKVYSVVLDTKRNRCISGSMDNVVKVWSLDTGMALFNLEGHSSLVGLLDLQQDRLVSAAADSTLRIWDPENGRCKSTLSAHTGAITCFQHDGHKVISGSDRTLKMWNVTSGEFVKDLLTDLSGVWQVKFNERRCVAAVQRNNYTFIEVSQYFTRTLLSWILTKDSGPRFWCVSRWRT